MFKLHRFRLDYLVDNSLDYLLSKVDCEVFFVSGHFYSMYSAGSLIQSQSFNESSRSLVAYWFGTPDLKQQVGVRSTKGHWWWQEWHPNINCNWACLQSSRLPCHWTQTWPAKITAIICAPWLVWPWHHDFLKHPQPLLAISKADIVFRLKVIARTNKNR